MFIIGHFLARFLMVVYLLEPVYALVALKPFWLFPLLHEVKISYHSELTTVATC